MPANVVFRRKIWGARDNGIPPRSTPGVCVCACVFLCACVRAGVCVSFEVPFAARVKFTLTRLS